MAEAQVAPATREPPRAGSRRLAVAEAWSLPALLLALIALFCLLPSTSATFPTEANLRVILGDAAIMLVVAAAVLVPIVCRVWDFTPGAVAGLAAIFAASAAADTGSVPAAVVVACGIGIGVGAVNGLLVTRAKVNSVIATLGATILIAGLVQLKTKGTSIVAGIPPDLVSFGRGTVLGLPTLFLLALAVCTAVFVMLTQTPFGRYLYAVGSNRAAARLAGLRVSLLVWSSFVISGALAGLAGLMLLARSGAGNPSAGPDLTLPAFAAVFLGATSIRPGQWNVWGAAMAVLFLGVLNSGLNLAGAATYVNAFANGLALLIGVIASNVLATKRGRDLDIA